MPDHDWSARYANEDTPWDSGVVCDHLAAAVDDGTLTPCRVLDAGCGTGTNAVWLALRGFEAVGCDLTPFAIERAKARALDAGVDVPFHVVDLLQDEVPGTPYDLVYDRAVFHVFDRAADRARFAENVARVLGPGGRWLSLSGSTEGPERDHGPPRRTLRDLTDAIEPHLELVWARSVMFASDLPSPAKAWLTLWQKREVPAQPATGS